jgi:putative oxidoreductase
MKYIVVLARVLFSLIFLASAPGHFTQQYVAYAAASGVPFAGILVPFAGLLAIAGGLSVLLGFKAKYGAWLLGLFLIPVTFTMHSFWSVADPGAAIMQRVMFMKNISILGGTLMIAYFGSGPLSLDAVLEAHHLRRHDTAHHVPA